MKQLTIIWEGEEKIIPGYGYATKGNELTLPDWMAESFVSQGKAKLKRKKSEVKLSTE